MSSRPPTLASLKAEELLILADWYAGAGLQASAADVYLSLAPRGDLAYELWPKLFAGLCRVNRWQSALAVFRRAAQERPDDDLAFYAKAQALARLRWSAEMIIGELRRAIDLNPSTRVRACSWRFNSSESAISAKRMAASPPRFDSSALFQGSRVVIIMHAGETYRLLLTRNNRLILQKSLRRGPRRAPPTSSHESGLPSARQHEAAGR